MLNAKSIDPAFIKKAVEVVMANLHQHDFSGNALAAALNLSREQTHRKIKRNTELSTGKFICYLRLIKAYSLITQHHQNIAEAAYHVGFESPAYFNKCFKEAFNVRPGDVKKNSQLPELKTSPILAFSNVPQLHQLFVDSGIVISTQETMEVAPAKHTFANGRAVWAYTLLAVPLLILFLHKSSLQWNNQLPAVTSSDSLRIAIIPFNNQTCDTLLSPIGDAASSWISGQLADLPNLSVVPFFTVKEYLPYLGILPNDPLNRPTLADVMEADYFVTGSYYVMSGRVYIDSRLVEAQSQKLVYSLPPVSASRDSVMQAVEAVRLKIAGLFTNFNDVKIGKIHPPSYSAYVHYLNGLAGLKSGLYPATALSEFEKATAEEPNFVMPQLFLTWFYRGAKRDSVVHLLAGLENTTTYEKSVCTELTDLVKRNYHESLQTSLKMLRRYPKDYYFNMIAGHRAKSQFMPHLAIEVLSKLQDPLQNDFGLVWHYYKVWNMTESFLMLGETDQALTYLNSIPANFHNRAIPSLMIAAYAMQGRGIAEIEAAIEKFSGNDQKLGAEYNTVAAYNLSLSSADESSRYFALKACSLFKTIEDSKGFDFDLIDALFLAREYTEARRVLVRRLEEAPGNLELLIYLSYVEAALQNTSAAEKIFSKIGQTLVYWRRHEFEYDIDYLKARMYALSGNTGSALNLVKKAYDKGQLRHHWDYERDIFLKSIFNTGEFKALVQPKGPQDVTGFALISQ